MKRKPKRRTRKKRDGYPVKYQMAHGGGVTVYLPFNPRKGKCEACGKIVGVNIRMTALHHWWYAYQPKTVKEHPLLALENTTELCYGCHQVADAIRALLYANPKRSATVALCLRSKPRERFIKALEHILVEMKAQDLELAKKILELGIKSGKED